MKIGLIQTRGLGDIIIAVPIAQFFIDAGHDVVWPVDSRFTPSLAAAFPGINFLPVDIQEQGGTTAGYFYDHPLSLLKAAKCDQIFCLYSYLTGLEVNNKKLYKSLKFDEYKYAITGVPFDRKWTLKITRDAKKEQVLRNSLQIKRKHVVVHEQGSDFHIKIQLPPDIIQNYDIIHIDQRTDNPFDWIGVIETAEMFIGVDSFFANLVEQLNLCSKKYLFLRSECRFTPVLKNGWMYQ
jgi:hypothetical protein